jgi:hypothetical protein
MFDFPLSIERQHRPIPKLQIGQPANFFSFRPGIFLKKADK